MPNMEVTHIVQVESIKGAMYEYKNFGPHYSLRGLMRIFLDIS